MKRRDEILEVVARVPALPSSAAEALRLAQDDQVRLDRLGGVIERDPALTANLLRLANCAWFGFARRVPTVREALIRLGGREVVHVVLAAIAAPYLQRPVRGYDLPVGVLWERSVATAVGAVELANALGLRPPGSLFEAALLADIGKIVLGSFVEAEAEPITSLAYEQEMSFEQAEREVLGISHAEVGAALLDGWLLPEEIVEVVRYHHQPELSGQARLATVLVHAADALCMILGQGTGADGLNYRLSDCVAQELPLQKLPADELVSILQERASEARQLIGLAGCAA
ncbi:MAG: HDOD domain-containing protein [Armatimonadetes bacterium]|nr:HDOD domain-containing protein [Armatimonadota bacterium]